MSGDVFEPQTQKITTFQKSVTHFPKNAKNPFFGTFTRFSVSSACNACLPYFDTGDINYSILALFWTKNYKNGLIEKKLWNFQFWVTNLGANMRFWPKMDFLAKIWKFAQICQIMFHIIIFVHLNHLESHSNTFPPQKTQYLLQVDNMKKIPIFSKNRTFWCSSACNAVQALVAKNFVGNR